MNWKLALTSVVVALCPFFQIACGDNHGGDVPPPSPIKKTIRIMPIGDSLTEANEPGYRGYLYNWLVADSLNVDFVGVNKKMPSNGGDEDHSGFGGFVIGPGASRTTSYCSPLGRVTTSGRRALAARNACPSSRFFCPVLRCSSAKKLLMAVWASW